MHYVVPCNPNLGAIGAPMDPLQFIEPAIALGPTRIIADPSAGYATYPGTHLAGLGDWRDAIDVLSAVNFLFP